MVKVLHVGKDALLLSTRSAVLRSIGWEISSECSVRKALSRLSDRRFDIVVLCHTVRLEEAHLFFLIAHNYDPAVPVVYVSDTYRHSDAAVDALIEPSPELLVTELPKLLLRSIA